MKFNETNVRAWYNSIMHQVAPHMATDSGDECSERIETIEDMFQEVCYHLYERYTGDYGGWSPWIKEEYQGYYREKKRMERFVKWVKANDPRMKYTSILEKLKAL